ncbi:hypothetical protein CR513_41178, partial [Mucuna pruriens]
MDVHEVSTYLVTIPTKHDARGLVESFVGQPSAGETSLASSITSPLSENLCAYALGDKMRRTMYVGSMPGQLIDGLKVLGKHHWHLLLLLLWEENLCTYPLAESRMRLILEYTGKHSWKHAWAAYSRIKAVCNPVMLLDEVDKTGSDIRGDPASALLEEVFVATANRLQPIPSPLLDRMEVIELPGYTPEEKLHIVVQHLIPRVLDQLGLSSEFLQIPEEMVKLVIQRYTREAGVQNLERNLAALARAVAVRVREQEQVVPLNKGRQGLATPLVENRLVEGTEFEMEVIAIGVNNWDISNTFRIASPLVVDEAMLEKVLGDLMVEKLQNVWLPLGLCWASLDCFWQRSSVCRGYNNGWEGRTASQLRTDREGEVCRLEVSEDKVNKGGESTFQSRSRSVDSHPIPDTGYSLRHGQSEIGLQVESAKERINIRPNKIEFISSFLSPPSLLVFRLIDAFQFSHSRVVLYNYVMLLDEVGKTGSNVQGDPALALLEYKHVFFVAIEFRIELRGYTPGEKLQIAMQHFIPRVSKVGKSSRRIIYIVILEVSEKAGTKHKRNVPHCKDVLEMSSLNEKSGGRTKVVLGDSSAHKLAEISFEEQLFMLDLVNPKMRLSKVIELIDGHLQ